jgi:hypothetical protein
MFGVFLLFLTSLLAGSYLYWQNAEQINTKAYNNYQLQIDSASSPSSWTVGTVPIANAEGGTVPSLAWAKCPSGSALIIGPSGITCESDPTQTPSQYNIPYICQSALNNFIRSNNPHWGHSFMGVVDRDTAITWNNIPHYIEGLFGYIPYQNVAFAVWEALVMNWSFSDYTPTYKLFDRVAVGVANSLYSTNSNLKNYHNNVYRPWAQSRLGQAPSSVSTYFIGIFRNSYLDMPGPPYVETPLFGTTTSPTPSFGVSATAYGDPPLNVGVNPSEVDNAYNAVVNYYNNGNPNRFIFSLNFSLNGLTSGEQQLLKGERNVNILFFYDERVDWHYVWAVSCVGSWVPGCASDEKYDPNLGLCVKYSYTCGNGSTYNPSTGKCEGQAQKAIVKVQVN